MSTVGSLGAPKRPRQFDFINLIMTSTPLINGITPLLITFNEARNIGRVMEKLCWATRIVVVDSGSTDATLEIVTRFTQAEVVHRPFDSFSDQCNFGLAQIRTEWVLSLDADYVLSDALIRELHELRDVGNVAGYSAAFVYCIYGRPLRATLYPPRTVLYRIHGARYHNEGHGHRVAISGNVGSLRGVIYHDDHKPLSRWLTSQQDYARREANYLLHSKPRKMSRADRIRRLGWPAPILVFFYVLFAKGCALDGWAGWFYALQRVLAETMIALELVDRRLLELSEKQREERRP